MKGGCVSYPNKGVKIDPRAITSAKMPESLKVYSGYLNKGVHFLIDEGFISCMLRREVYEAIGNLPPLNRSKNKIKSSYWFSSDNYRVEFLRTSNYNYKIYAFKVNY